MNDNKINETTTEIIDKDGDSITLTFIKGELIVSINELGLNAAVILNKEQQILLLQSLKFDLKLK